MEVVKTKTDKLSFHEKFISEMIWGGVPTDTEWVRQSHMFKNGIKLYISGEWDKFIFDLIKSKLPFPFQTTMNRVSQRLFATSKIEDIKLTI